MTAPSADGPSLIAEEALYFEDFEAGQTFVTGSWRVTAEEIATFASLTGDDNPLHSDPEFAKSTPFGTVVAHGLLATSITIGLLARLRLFTGTALALLEAHSRFLLPVAAGDEIHARLTIAKKRETSKPDRGLLWRFIQLVNQRDEVVQEIEFTSLVRRRPAGDRA